MTVEEIRHRLSTDEDFIPLKRFDYSMRCLLDRYPDGVPDRIIAQSLLIDDEQVEVLYQEVVAKLRTNMKVET
jgi:hypothetical protein